jgi:hypothetical protein
MAEWGIMCTAEELAIECEALVWMAAQYRDEPPASWSTLAHKAADLAAFAIQDLVSLGLDATSLTKQLDYLRRFFPR